MSSLDHFEAPTPDELRGLGEIRALAHRHLELRAFEDPACIEAAIDWIDRVHYIASCRLETAKRRAKGKKKEPCASAATTASVSGCTTTGEGCGCACAA